MEAEGAMVDGCMIPMTKSRGELEVLLRLVKRAVWGCLLSLKRF